MTSIVCLCDHCGRLSRSRGRPPRHDYRLTIFDPHGNVLAPLDLCATCAAKLVQELESASRALRLET